jgi:hypothetical protein
MMDKVQKHKLFNTELCCLTSGFLGIICTGFDEVYKK